MQSDPYPARRRRQRAHNRALAELAATKTELVSVLLHEVRTPLTAAMTMAEMISDRDDEAIAVLIRNLRRIDEVTREISTIAGIESGTVALAGDRFDLPALLAEVTGGAVAARPTAGDVIGDRDRLAQVFRRLLGAVRALGGPPEPVGAGLADGQWWVALRLPAGASADRLFTEGNATALMLARAVAGRHGGTVGVEREHLTLRLPSAPPPGSAGPAR